MSGISTAETRARYYGASAIRLAEADRAAKSDAEKAHYRSLLIDGPTLTVPQLGQYSFNPSTLVSLGNGATVYPTFHTIADWGTLDVQDGVLVRTDSSGATLAAPKDTNGPRLEGPG